MAKSFLYEPKAVEGARQWYIEIEEQIVTGLEQTAQDDPVAAQDLFKDLEQFITEPC